VQVDRALAEKHYAVHQGKFFYEGWSITSPPVRSSCWCSKGTKRLGRCAKMVGATRPVGSRRGTLRGDYALMGLRNLIHASDAPETAANEIALWFTPRSCIRTNVSSTAGSTNRSNGNMEPRPWC